MTYRTNQNKKNDVVSYEKSCTMAGFFFLEQF